MHKHHHSKFPYWFLVLLVPLFVLNVNSCFDWGDDYAQYMLQAKQIATGKSITEIEMPGIQVYSPAYRPVGFPLLLSPFYFLFKQNALGYMYMMSALLAALAVVCFLFLHSYANKFISALLVLVFIYNPLTIRLKAEVLADIPFTLCVISVLYLSHHHKKWFTLLLVLVAMLLKNAGLVLWLGLLLYEIKKIIFAHNHTKHHKPDYLFLVYTALVPALYFLINHVLFKIPVANEVWYKDLFFNKEIMATVKTNCSYYYKVFSVAFEQEVPMWLNAVIKIFLTVFILTGIISKWKERMGAGDFVFIVYVLMILAYPYHKGGYRFIFPVMPLLLLYLYSGMNFYFSRLKSFRVFPVAVFLLLVLLSYTINLVELSKNNCTTIAGPHQADFTDVVYHYKKNCAANDVVLFARPWALKYFGNVQASPVINQWSVAQFKNHISFYRIKYVLACTNKHHELYQKGLIDFLETEPSKKVVWQNKTYALFLLVPPI